MVETNLFGMKVERGWLGTKFCLQLRQRAVILSPRVCGMEFSCRSVTCALARGPVADSISRSWLGKPQQVCASALGKSLLPGLGSLIALAEVLVGGSGAGFAAWGAHASYFLLGVF